MRRPHSTLHSDARHDAGFSFSRPKQFSLCQFESALVAWSLCCGVSAQEGGGDRLKAPFPGFVEPALATSIEKVPSGDRWIHEIKFDGYRVQLHIHNDAIKVLTRRGNDWTRRFSKIAADAYLINAGSRPSSTARSSCRRQTAPRIFPCCRTNCSGKSKRLVMIAFDLLYLNGQDLRKLPLIERKAHLKKLIEKTAIQFSESFEVDGKEMFAHACKVGLEGVVSKVRDSRYLSGRSRTGSRKPAPSARR